MLLPQIANIKHAQEMRERGGRKTKRKSERKVGQRRSTGRTMPFKLHTT